MDLWISFVSNELLFFTLIMYFDIQKFSDFAKACSFELALVFCGHVCIISSLNVLLFSGSISFLGSSGMSSEPLLQGLLIPFSGEWYLEIKIWVLGVLIAPGMSLLLVLRTHSFLKLSLYSPWRFFYWPKFWKWTLLTNWFPAGGRNKGLDLFSL